MKKILAAIATLILIAVIGIAAAVYLLLGNTGAGDELRNYLGRQITGIVNGYLVPQLEFERLNYQQPGTINITNAKLIAPDGTDVLDVESFTITLTEVPKIGQPLKIEKIAIDGGAVNLISDGAGGFKGLSPIAKANPVEEESEAQVDENFRLSNVLELKRIEITDVNLVYDDGSGADPMTIEGFQLITDIVKAEQPDDNGAPSGPGWYELAIDSGREPGLTLDLDGRLNIDTFDVFLENSLAEIKLDESTRTSLPGQIQQIVAEYELQGDLKLNINGQTALTDPVSGDLKLDLTGTDMRVAFGDYRVPVQSLTGDVSLASKQANLNSINIQTLGGTIDLDVNADLSRKNMPANLNWSISNIELQQALKPEAQPSNEPPKLAGLFQTQGSARTRLADPQANLSGNGTFAVTDGRLVAIPIVTSLSEAIGGRRTAANTVLNHRANGPFRLTPSALVLEEGTELQTSLVAARINGNVGFDQSLNLLINGGPLEKIQSQLGGIGNILGKVTDGIVKYRVRGTLAEPKVNVTSGFANVENPDEAPADD